MKSPLRYQLTEFECGSVSLLNCLSYLFEREEMPAELVRAVSIYSLDSYDERGRLDLTSSRNVSYSVARWVTQIAKQKNIPLKCSYLKADMVTIYAIVDCLKKGGCVSLRTYRDGEKHFVTVTAVDNEYIYLFDPYFKSSWDYKNSKDIQVIEDNPFAFNRRVKIDYFLSEKKQELTMGAIVAREAVMFMRDDASMERVLG